LWIWVPAFAGTIWQARVTRMSGSDTRDNPGQTGHPTNGSPARQRQTTATACSIGHHNDFIQNANRRTGADYFFVYAL
jgi:hypothetical protein